MFDRELLKLIGGDKKYVVYTVLFMVLGMLANIGIVKRKKHGRNRVFWLRICNLKRILILP